MFRNLIAFFVFLLGNLALLAQDPYAIKFDKSNGMPSNEVYDMLQAEDGLIWYAHAEGISSYDGKFHKTYYCDKQTSLAGSHIKMDQYGRVWYENFDGYLYYFENDSLKSINQNPPITYVPYGITRNHLFVVQKFGIDVYDLKSLKRIKTFDLESFDVETGYSDPNFYYFISNGNVYKIDASLQVTSSNLTFSNKINNSLLLVKNNLVFIIPQNELKLQVLNVQLELIGKFEIPEIEFANAIDFVDNLLWIHSNNGSFAYEYSNNQLVLKNHLFGQYKLSRIIKDYQDNFWFSSLNQGLLLVTDINNRVFNNKQINGHKIIRANDDLIIATIDGNLIIKKGNGFKKLLSEPLPSNIYYLYQDELNNNLFISHYGFDIVPRGDINKRIYINSALKKVIKLDEKYYAMAMSGFIGLFLSPTAPSQLNSKWDVFFEKNKDPFNYSFAKIEDKIRAKSLAYNPLNNTIVCVSNIGVLKVSPQSKKLINYNKQAIYAKEIEYFDNNFYILSTKGNLYQLSENDTYTLLNPKLKIPEYEIKNIKKHQDKLCFYTASNIYIYNFKTKELNTLNININPNEILDFEIINNLLYLITNESLLEFDLNKNQQKLNAIKFKLNALVVNQKPYNYTTPLKIKHHENNVTIQFSILDFGNSIPNQMFYQLNNEAWIPVPKDNREIQFTKLPSGNYTLKFKLNQQILADSISFSIATPFWKSIWFILLCSFGTIALFYYYYQWRLKIISKEFKLKRDKLQLEKDLSKSVLTSIKSQMNPHFFYNALNTIQSYLFTNDKRNAINYLSKFSKLTRMILEMSENESIKLNEEIKALTLYLELEKMRFDNDFMFNIEMATTVDLEMVKIPSMLIQPYVENAVKHGLLHKEGEKHLSIKFDKENKYLKVTIEDNGIGRKKSEELNKIKDANHASYATQANLKRLEILNKDLENSKPIEIIDLLDKNNLPQGTKVILYIPIS